MGKKRNLKMWVVMAVFLVGMSPVTAAGGTIYVDADASSGGDGTNWATAYKYLQDALPDASSGDEIWVVEGTYQPDANSANPTGTNDRTATFQLTNGVAFYGGFAGGESSLNERDLKTNKTILSGDLDGNDVQVDNPEDLFEEPTRAENSYKVVTGSGTDATAVLDGFTITGGFRPGMYNDAGSPTVTNCIFSENSASLHGGGMRNLDGSNPTVSNCTFSDNFDGGMYNEESSPTVTNCTFTGNWATEGAGMYNEEHSSPTVTNCTFRGNTAGEDGGGMASRHSSNPRVTNCTFSGNTARWCDGGGMDNYQSSPTITNCTFSGNLASNDGGGMCNEYYSSSTVTNCIFWGNYLWFHYPERIGPISNMYSDVTSSVGVSYCDLQGGWPGEGNIDAEPCFADTDTGDYHLQSQAGRWDPNSESWVTDANTSACIDAGNPSCPLSDEPNDSNNIRINMGTYGGTVEASMSPYDWALLGDLTNDGTVNLQDFAAQANDWLESESEQPGDLNRNGTVDVVDVALLTEYWLKQASRYEP